MATVKLQRKAWIDVRDYGATGDGVTDDTSAIQDAIDAAALVGGSVFFAFTWDFYLISAPLEVPDDVGLVGAHPSVKIKLADATEVHMVVNSDQVSGNSNVSIESLTLDGNRATMDSGVAANASMAVYMVGVDRLHLHNVRVVDILDQGFKLKDCTNLTGGGLEVDGAGTDGYSFDNVDDGELFNLIARNCDGARSASCWGYEVEDGCSNLRLTNVYAEDCSAAGGFHVQSHGTLWCEDIIVTNLVVRNATSGAAFGLDAGHDRIVVNGVTASNVQSGFSLGGAQNLTVTGIDVHATTWGVRLVSDISDGNLRFVGGRIKSDLHGIRFDTNVNVDGLHFAEVDIIGGGVGAAWNMLAGTSATDCKVVGGSIVSTGTAEALTVKSATGFAHDILFSGVRIRAEQVTDGFTAAALFVNDGNTGIRFRDCDISCEGSDSLFLVSIGEDCDVRFFGGSMKVDTPVDMNGVLVDDNSIVVLDGVLIEDVVGGSSKFALAASAGSDVQIRGVRFKDVNRAIANDALSTGAVLGCTLENVASTKMSDPTNTGWRVRDNTGFVTAAQGSDTLLNGNTTVDVTHGLDYTPRLQDIRISPNDATFAALEWYISAVTGSTFTVTVTGAPGSDADFGWQAGL